MIDINQFGDYTSYLEIAFVINFAVGTWRDLTQRLLDSLIEKADRYFQALPATEKDMGDIGQGIARTRQNRFVVRSYSIQKYGRFVSVFVAIFAIAPSLLFSEHSTYIYVLSTEWWFIAVAPLPGLIVYAAIFRYYLKMDWSTRNALSAIEDSIIDMNTPVNKT